MISTRGALPSDALCTKCVPKPESEAIIRIQDFFFSLSILCLRKTSQPKLACLLFDAIDDTLLFNVKYNEYSNIFGIQDLDSKYICLYHNIHIFHFYEDIRIFVCIEN